MLLTALAATDAGIRAASSFLDVTGNNVANSDTPGYKTSQVTFQDLLYTGTKPGAFVQGVTSPTGSQLGTGAIVDAITGRFTQGGLQASQGAFDLAITGEGFFPVTLTDGTTGYTRAGNFVTDSAGQLVTPQGYLLAGGLVVPPNTASISVGADGTVTALSADGTQAIPIGQLALTRFTNPNGLSRFGDNVFTATGAAGASTTDAPGASGLGTVTQGFLELSNVDLPTELVNLIIAQQAFRFNTQALQVESDVLQATVDLIR